MAGAQCVSAVTIHKENNNMSKVENGTRALVRGILNITLGTAVKVATGSVKGVVAAGKDVKDSETTRAVLSTVKAKGKDLAEWASEKKSAESTEIVPVTDPSEKKEEEEVN
jgi:hypothetical protein